MENEAEKGKGGERLTEPGWRGLPWRGLVGVMVLSIAVQLAGTANVKLLPDYDEAIYWDVSRNCHRTGLFMRSFGDGGLFFDHPPLFLYFASPVFALTDDMAGIRLVVSGLSALLLASTALLASRLFGRDAALPAAVLLAFNPMFVFYANSAYQDVPFCVPTLLGVLSALAGKPVASGLFTGAACLVKYFALGFAGCIGLFFLRQGPEGPQDAARFAAVFFVVASLWPAAGLQLDASGFKEKAAYWHENLAMKTTTAIKHHPVVGRAEYLQSVLDRMTPLHALVLATGLAFGLARFPRASWQERFVVMTAGAYLFTLLGPFALRTDRYFVEALPLLAVLAAGLFTTAAPTTRFALLGIVSIAGLLLPMPGTRRLPMLVRPQFAPAVIEFSRQVEEAGAWLRTWLRPEDGLVVDWNGPRFGYMTRHNYRFLYARKDLAEVMAEIDRSRVVVRDHESAKWHLPYLSAEEIGRVEARLAAEFHRRDFGPVAVYVRN
ncbi:MAG: glycosyltransferase family 39 protein [Candidatus Wallbacteria bacterium]|nr:glycosyltransferase family 39 protein [Candidatus Wallbacteria bacterium]